MRVLVTGFAPFGGQLINPSWEAVSALDPVQLSADIITHQLPVEWHSTREVLRQLLEKHRPDAVLLFGQAGGRVGISIERLAVNLCDCAAPDNVGVVLRNTPIVPRAPDALSATLPSERILAALTEAGIPASFSYDAGRFLCNLVFWSALEEARRAQGAFTAGFFHLPFLPGQKEGAPDLSLARQTEAVQIILQTVIAQNKAENIT